MARRIRVNQEPYNGFLPPSQIPQLNPVNTYYTTDSRCKRYFCAVCGDCHPVNTDCTQRITEWLTGTTLPDSLHRSLEANIIDSYTQMRFKKAKQVEKSACDIVYMESERRKNEANALSPC
ncbi:hypothetical protein CSKR_105086 [Clonorchis sinensis]|uniref:Uncharacterized protein n=2 Tax=Clonorchis sinensis TaxID=79923 RepID=A0A8T1M8A1_CLOSI|nr:hypothetical protein CSKR_105086 [Clonorchis sinensis]GAA50194.1 hypothetical protein CLF_104213 [Clonorchis sinensis]